MCEGKVGPTRHRPYGRMGSAALILNRGAGLGEWSASRPSRFTRAGSVYGIHSVGSWVGPRTGLGVLEKRKLSGPCSKWSPVSPDSYPTAWSFTNYAVTSICMWIWRFILY
jgi:hypothetical protein